MSAWLLPTRHMDVLAKALVDYGITTDPQATGKALLAANYRSLAARYGDPIPRSKINAYRYRDRGDTITIRNYVGEGDFKVTPNFLLKVAGCYDYQACEVGHYERTKVAGWIRRLTAALEAQGADTRSDEYRDAPWGLF